MALTVSLPILRAGFWMAMRGSLAAAACSACMRQIDARRDGAAFEAAVGADDIEGRRRAGIDDDQRATG